MSSNITKEKAIEIANEMVKDIDSPIVSVTAILERDYGSWMVIFTVDDDMDPAQIMITVNISTGKASYFVHP
jgi:hypothetical protein